MKVVLTSLRAEEIRSLEGYTLEPLLKEVEDKDGTEWLRVWAIDRILEGALYPDRWIHLVTGVETERLELLLQKLKTEDFSIGKHPGVIPILRTCADASMVQRVFVLIRELDAQIEAAQHVNCQTEAHIKRQLVDFLRSLPLAITVEGVLKAISPAVEVEEVFVAIELWGGIGSDDKRFREEISSESREKLRSYLRSAVAPILAVQDFAGEKKASLAITLAQVGAPEDMQYIEKLVAADIERIREGIIARQKGLRDQKANGASMRHSPWFLQAARQLDEKGAAALTLKVLGEPEYENDAAWSLVRLASTTQIPATTWTEGWYGRDRDYQEIWQARTLGKSIGFREPQRQEYAKALRAHVEDLLQKTSDPHEKTAMEWRLKTLMKPLAALDAHDSRDFILQVLEIPISKVGNLDGWNRVSTLQTLLFGGVKLSAAKTIAILSLVTDIPKSQWQSDNDRALTGHALSLLPFVDDPSIGIKKVSDWLKNSKLYFEPLRRLVAALGNSQASEALPLLIEIAREESYANSLSDTWFNVVFSLKTPEAKELLLSFVDPSLPGLSEKNAFGRDDILTSRLAELANQDDSLRERLFALTRLDRKYLLCSALVF